MKMRLKSRVEEYRFERKIVRAEGEQVGITFTRNGKLSFIEADIFGATIQAKIVSTFSSGNVHGLSRRVHVVWINLEYSGFSYIF